MSARETHRLGYISALKDVEEALRSFSVPPLRTDAAKNAYANARVDAYLLVKGMLDYALDRVARRKD